MLLVRDSNRMVQVAAARSPLLNESEVALISRNRNISEEVLRAFQLTDSNNLLQSKRDDSMFA